ncbi:outer membrane beta-barrel protein [Carboxylicivirga sp. A043]|uniref:porin family protein n=1 Tax=Carboxylicivirga litoralis TaxID=2816963 RepID=UPI0021CB6063|nr:porin family protein [Carboxylicivirga sp. A043]MCU4155607.1 outer membrane beta-barrel protein [Carboxylicivirga sp. A043]
MKQLFLLIGLVTMVSIASAQESKIMAGGGLTYATDIDNIGINIKGLYMINETWEADGGFTYFFEKNNMNYSALDFNGHYVFMNNEGTCLYGLAGINITFYKFDYGNAVSSAYNEYVDEYSEYAEYIGYEGYSPLGLTGESKGSEFGFNIGAGGRMPISDALFLTGEVKYTLGDLDYFSINAGIMYQF